jgi:hypothetical protein
MCNPVSLILTPESVHMPTDSMSHTRILQREGIPDTSDMPQFIRVECSPSDGDWLSDPCCWRIIIDQDYIPQWYLDDSLTHDVRIHDAVHVWFKDHATVVEGYGLTRVEDDKLVVYTNKLPDNYRVTNDPQHERGTGYWICLMDGYHYEYIKALCERLNVDSLYVVAKSAEIPTVDPSHYRYWPYTSTEAEALQLRDAVNQRLEAL